MVARRAGYFNPANNVTDLSKHAFSLAAAESDPDALPLTDAQMDAMVPLRVLRGLPKLENKKQLLSIRWP